MTQYQFDQNNHFYREMVLFAGTYIGLQGLWAYKRSSDEIKAIIDWSNLPNPRPNMVVKNVGIPDRHEAAGKVANCTITNAKQIADSMQNSNPIESVACIDQALVSTDIAPSDTLIGMRLPPSILTLAA